ncbi:MAG: hypothetical protein KatS3mg110_2614 [Pirellulaceae bacterium]|nr:MAG: hypothetical protein KatS3mg110_2614 [Pirellulaceae bacterium]
MFGPAVRLVLWGIVLGAICRYRPTAEAEIPARAAWETPGVRQSMREDPALWEADHRAPESLYPLPLEALQPDGLATGIGYRRWLGLTYTDPNAPGRHVGLGEPLVGTSWLNRPLHVGWLVGAVAGDDLIKQQEGQEADLFGGYRIGWDSDHYWGWEYRLAFARPDLVDAMAGESPRIARHWYSDVHLVHYPWGDSRWRPFLSAGIGWANFRFTDTEGREFDEILLHLPLGAGLKYYVGRWMALRFDATDNIAVSGSGLDTMHNWTFSVGVESHFGPGTPSRYGYGY